MGCRKTTAREVAMRYADPRAMREVLVSPVEDRGDEKILGRPDESTYDPKAAESQKWIEDLSRHLKVPEERPNHRRSWRTPEP